MCFRPRSGNYESECLDWLGDKQWLVAVSVPARGIMNLNTITKIKRELGLCFRPRSGNYESESFTLHELKGRVLVSVPARGIMNLNNGVVTCTRDRATVSVPARGIMNLNRAMTNEQEQAIHVSVPARGIMNLNVLMALSPACTIRCFRPRSGNYESECQFRVCR